MIRSAKSSNRTLAKVRLIYCLVCYECSIMNAFGVALDVSVSFLYKHVHLGSIFHFIRHV